jgi:hypothetical protein
VLQNLSPAGQAALLQLANATVFTSSHIGFSGTLSPHAAAFRALLAERAAHAAFAELADSKHPEPQLYGLAGLYLVDQDQFQSRANQLLATTTKARTLQGCTGGDQTISAIIGSKAIGPAHLLDGSWPRDLAGHS